MNDRGNAPGADATSKVSRTELEIVSGLRSVFSTGRTRSLSWRIRQLDGLERLLSEQSDAIGAALVTDLGRNPAETFLTEIYGVRREVRELRRGIERWSRIERVRLPLALQPGRASIRRDPLGIVLVIGPWNYPVDLILAPLAAGVAAGNCVIAKPSEFAPASSALLAKLVPRYLDETAVVVVEGGASTSSAFIDEGVDHVFFTGSPAVGREVMARAAKRLTPVTLELGGKSPVYIDVDVDIDVAARRIAWGKYMNAGQSCIAPDYALVHVDRESEFLTALERSIRELYGARPGTSPDFGRILNATHVDRIARLLADHDGTVLCGGEFDRDTCYVAPTVISAPSLSSAIMEEEIFGPLLPVISVTDASAAIEFINERPTPLALYVFTSDSEMSKRFLDRTRSGTACINTTMHQFSSSRLPFGGVGASGIGRYHGRWGYEALTHLRPVLQKPFRPDLTFAYPPYGRLRSRLTRRVLSRPYLDRRPQ